MAEEKILATVNGAKITKQDADQLISSIDPKQAAQFKSEEGQKQILNELINRKLFLMDALDNNVEKENDFQKRLEEVKNEILTQYAVGKVLKDVSVSMNEVEKYYFENKEKFKKPDTIKASHILLKEKEEADSILKKIKDGMAFEEAANKYSLCTEKNGGDLGYFPRGKMVQEFEDVAFSMKPGEVSEPVKTQFGYHIIKVFDKKKGDTESYKNIKHQLKQQLTSMKQREIYKKKVAEFKDKYEVKVK